MTNKKQKKQKKTIPIFIFFKIDQVPSDLKGYAENIKNSDISSKNFVKKDKKIFVFLNNLGKLNKLQRNYYLLYAGVKLGNFCDEGKFHIEYFGDSSGLYAKNIDLGWFLSTYSFQRFKKENVKSKKRLLISRFDQDVVIEKNIYFFVRDLINMPANILGPREIFESAKDFFKDTFSYKSFKGARLKKEFPLIQAVGKGASEEKSPLLCEFKLERKKKKLQKKIFIVGKGVSFDTGGLNLKSGAGMSLMKKDMGGAANAIGLAKLLSSKNLNINIHLLLCLVENSVSENSIRPSDIFKSRQGMHVEVSDTDAEGRLIMADALRYASESKPDLIIDMATLTGASRVAMGTDIPSFFCNNDELSMNLIKSSQEVGDPVWQLPLWQNYLSQLTSTHADIKNLGNSMFGGAITAALFLEQFVDSGIPWIHVDLMAWSKPNRLSNYDGGEAMGIRALANLIEKNFC